MNQSATNHPDRTEEFFDQYAAAFSAIYGNRNTPINHLVNKLFRKSMRLRFELSIEGCEPVKDRSVLDIGCGPGHYGIELARRGASRVVGIDFAEGMLEIANAGAIRSGVKDVCQFIRSDFFNDSYDERFDYTIAMGFMDYVATPAQIVRKAVDLAKVKAFFSFPLDGGLLAMQRKWRYKSRCDLYLYKTEQVRRLFDDLPVKRIDIQVIDRDLFVTAHRQ